MTIQPLDYYIQGILNADRRTLAKAITLVESRLPEHRNTAQHLIDALLEHTGRAIRLGISGIPGVGKSTFIESFGMQLIDQGHRVAVLAIDPSSQRSGGSILADKTRMEKLAVNPSAFIRPSPSSGNLGGVARMTRETLLLCEAAGFDVVIVETVGVGQNETTVAGMVDFFLLLMITGAGDVLQGIKRGILELAHAVTINKADGDNRQAAERTRKELEKALHLMQPASPLWKVPVVTCSALTLEGLDRIWELIETHHQRMTDSGELQHQRKEQSLQWMWTIIDEGLKERFFNHPTIKQCLPKTLEQVRRGDIEPTRAASDLLFLLDKNRLDKKEV